MQQQQYWQKLHSFILNLKFFLLLIKKIFNQYNDSLKWNQSVIMNL